MARKCGYCGETTSEQFHSCPEGRKVVDDIFILGGYEGKHLDQLAVAIVDDAKRVGKEEQLRWILERSLELLSVSTKISGTKCPTGLHGHKRGS